MFKNFLNKGYSVDEVSAFYKDGPMRECEDVLENVKTKKISKEQINVIKDKWWYHSNKNNKTIDKRMYVLRDKLLKFGGYEACLPANDEDIDNILEHGQIWYGKNLKMMYGEPSHCHSNSSHLWMHNKDRVFLCTGYALSKDGIWRQHSWCVECRAQINRVVETTEARLLYFGFAMTEEQAEEFLQDNY